MASPTLRAGLRVEAYELLAPLGAGGMGEVWKARDTRLDRTVAIKFAKAGFGERFEREARAVAALSHPNICQIFDVAPDHFVMEYVDGAPVRPLESTRGLIEVAVQIADGLAAAHAAGVVHRDLKPDNILVTRSGRVKILDFGLARLQAAEADATAALTITRPGTVMGTLAYMSPEQARGQELDARSDQFSFGVILYELAAGRSPFRKESSAETMAALIRDEAPPLPAAVPPALRWVIERLLSKDPAGRYDSTRDLYTELRAMPARLAELSDTKAPAMPAPARRVRAGHVAVALVVASCAALLWGALGRQPPVDTSRLRFTPFAATQASEGRPAWSPDGQSIAYIATEAGRSQIMVRRVDRRAPATALAVAGSQFTWSPDGERLYFSSLDRATRSSRVMSVARAGGEPAVVLDAGPGVPGERTGYEAPALSPDGRTLALIVTVSRGAANPSTRRLAFSSPPGNPPIPVGDPLPCCVTPNHLSWAPDGSRLLLRITEGYQSVVYVVTKTGTSRTLFQIPRPELEVTFSWIPGTRYAVTRYAATRYAVTSALNASDQDQGLHLLDTGSGAISPLMPSAAPLLTPSVSPDGSRIAYGSRLRQQELLGIPTTGQAVTSLLPSNLDQHSIAFSPRRNEFVFVRLRELWVLDQDRNEERVLLSRQDFPKALSPPSFAWPEYSRDGERIVFTCIGCERELSFWVVPVRGGTPARVAGDQDGGLGATWSPDGQWIAYSRAGSGLVKLRVGGGRPIPLARRCTVPSWSPDGEAILCLGQLGLELVSPEGRPLRSFDQTRGELPMAGFTWSRDGRSIFYIRADPGRTMLHRLDVSTGRSTEVAELPPGFRPSSTMAGARLSLSADGKMLATSVAAGESDIWIMDGFELPRRFWEIWPR